jgi:putative cell wall-binding protein
VQNAPVLLVDPANVPAPIAVELERLDPERLVVLGGTAAVSAAVEEALKPFLLE